MKNNVSADDLAIFLVVVREGGFRAAARRLSTAPSRVSAIISRIEGQLGTPILHRTTRSLFLTDAGRLLLDRVRPLLSALDEVCLEVAALGSQVQGRLKLNVPGAVMPDILPRLLAEYRVQHPGVEVEIIVESNLVDIVSAGCDAGIRYGSVLEQDMISIPIGPRWQQMALAAAPSYIDAHGMPQSPAELITHDAIRYRLGGGQLLPWELECRGRSVQIEPVNVLILSVGALDTGRRYAREGMGVVHTFRNWLEEDFVAGTLLPILPNWWPKKAGPYLYYPSRSAAAPLRAFIDVCQAATG